MTAERAPARAGEGACADLAVMLAPEGASVSWTRRCATDEDGDGRDKSGHDAGQPPPARRSGRRGGAKRQAGSGVSW